MSDIGYWLLIIWVGENPVNPAFQPFKVQRQCETVLHTWKSKAPSFDGMCVEVKGVGFFESHP